MYRRLKVFAVSFLAAVLFCLPVSADFSSSDSLNLSNIRTYTSYLQTYLPSINSSVSNSANYLSSLVNQFTMIDGVTSMIRDIRNSLNISLSGSFAQQLLSAIQSLNKDGLKDFNTDNALYCFDSFHYSGNTNSSYPGMIQSSGNFVVFQNTSSRYLSTYLPAGDYILLINISVGMGAGGVTFESNANVDEPTNFLNIPGSQIPSIGIFGNTQRFRVSFSVPVGGIYFGDFWIALAGEGYGAAYLYLVNDNSLSSSINPSQGGLVSSVDNAGLQQQQQEEQLWTNVNDYKSNLTFNIDDWSEAASGLTYVTSVFMIVWNNSPTQIIILSLMLGIAMLAIGRGVMAAVRVQHNNGRNSQDSG